MARFSFGPEEFDMLRRLVYEHSGIWLGDDKGTFLNVRIADLMRDSNAATVRDYYYALKFDASGEAVQRLIDAVTIQETWFFREAEPLEAWRTAVLPDIVKRTGRLRLWSAACSTGEEPYTLAMMMLEYAPGVPFEIVATDISTRALAVARTGVYDMHSLRRTAPRWVSKYFEPTADGRWSVSEAVRRPVRFDHGNVLDAAVVARTGSVDVVVCRNLLIYFDDRSRRAALANFGAALRPGGILVLGFSEGLTMSDIPFEVVRIEGSLCYRKPVTTGALITEGFQ